MARAAARWERWAPLLLPVLLVLVGYSETLNHPLVYDDRTTIVNNPSLRVGELRELVAFDPKRPLVNITYAIDYALTGVRPLAYHVSNLLLHILNVLLLGALARALAEDAASRRGAPLDDATARRVGVVAASLFAAHPLLTEAVGYASSRPGLMATAFALGGMLLYRRGVAVGAIACLIVGASCKESAAMLPVAWLAWDLLLAPERGRRLWRWHVPIFALLALGGALRLFVFARHELSGIRPMGEHVATQLGVFWSYVRLALLPVGLSLAHDAHVASGFTDVSVLASLAGLLVLAAISWRLRRRAPLAVFGVVWLVAFLLPSSAVPLAEIMSEHRTYEAFPGVCFLAAALALAPLSSRRPVRLAFTAIVGVLLVATVSRNRVWATPVALWQDAVARAPGLWTARYALANEYEYAGDCARALPEYRESIRLQPTQRAVLNVGVCLVQLGRRAEAIPVFAAATRMGPSVDAFVDLGLALAEERRAAEAGEALRAAIALDPGQLAARQALANLDEGALDDPTDLLTQCREIAARAPSTAGVDGCIARAQARLAVQAATIHP